MNDFRAVVDAVRDRTDLVSLVWRDVELHQAGSVLKGSSPFRNDADPSFVVWPHSQTWRDFSGASDDGGDCLDYVMARDGVGFWEALHTLADEAGVDVPGREDDQLRDELDKLSERRRLERLLTEAARYYHQVLPSKLRGSWYRDRYGFTDETVDKLLLGWADGHLYEHLVGVVGATEEEALSTGLFVRFRDGRVTDFFQQRLVFPYWRRGRVVYFIARQTELTPEAPWEQAKYKKLLTRSGKHPYVSALVQNDTFYNEDAATRGRVRQLLVTEGVTDCISAMQAGSEVEKEAWISTLSELCKKQASAKADRKLGYAAQRRRELEERTREAERRKAAVLATCGVSGMKHTAAAMMNRA